MPHITFVYEDGARREIDAAVGMTVMEAAIQNNVPGIEAECGGCCSCGTCHVYVDPSSPVLPPPRQETEEQTLEGVAAPRTSASRLSCQLRITPELDGLVVRIPALQA